MMKLSLKISNIRDEEKYEGVRVTLEASFQTIRQRFKIDITTGDIIIPKEVRYKFKLMFNDKEIEILAYNLETIISEKFETIISRSVANTRARDFYDLYIINKLQSSNYDIEVLGIALKQKFNERGSIEKFNNITEEIGIIENSEELKNLWAAYRRDYIYAQEIGYREIISVLKEFAKNIE